MRVRGFIVMLVFVLIVAVGSVAADVQVRARVDRTSVAPGESLQLMVTINGGDGSVNVDAITDFKVLSRGTSTNVQFINGRTSREVTYNYTLIPNRKGTLTIPALTVSVGDRYLLTDPIRISVASSTADGTDSSEQEVWVTAEVSDVLPYSGQQIIYTFSLFNAVQVSDAKFQPPEFEGFSARELQKRDSFRKLINGREHIVTQVYYVLIPQREGILTIEPATLQVGIVRPNRRQRGLQGFDSIFNDPFFNRGSVEPRVLRTEPLEVRVRALPPYQGQEPFSGLVGRFDLNAGIESNDLKTGDSTTVTVTVEGLGNIMDATPPPLQVPDAFKTYADAPQEEITATPSGYSGKKIFRTALVPVKAGRFTLAPVKLTYFDVARQNYRTLSSAPIDVSVRAGVDTAAPVTITALPATPQKQAVTFTGRDILPLKESMDAVVSRAYLSFAVFLICLGAPLVAFGGLLLVQRLRRTDETPAARMKAKARRALKAAVQAGADRDGVMGHIYQALSAAIFAAARRSGEALTWKEAEAVLLESGWAPEVARRAADLLVQIESTKFSGEALSAEKVDELLSDVRHMVRKLAP
jgi:hypothetical protein